MTFGPVREVEVWTDDPKSQEMVLRGRIAVGDSSLRGPSSLRASPDPSRPDNAMSLQALLSDVPPDSTPERWLRHMAGKENMGLYIRDVDEDRDDYGRNGTGQPGQSADTRGIAQDLLQNLGFDRFYQSLFHKALEKTHSLSEAMQLVEGVMGQYPQGYFEARRYGRDDDGIENYAALKDRLERAAEAVHQKPSEAQKDAGNYRHGHITIQGLPITIEVPRGGQRHGREINCSYGRIKRTEGADGEQVDVFIGPHPESELVFVIDQMKRPTFSRFDEHKVCLGWTNRREARDAYLACYPKDWECGPITTMTMDQFREWLRTADLYRPASKR